MGCTESRTNEKTFFTQTAETEADEESIKITEDLQFRLFDAIRDDDVNALNEFFKKGLEVNLKLPFFYERTPLHIACQVGSTKVVELLIGRGADLKAEDTYGISAIFLAEMKGSEKCVRMLKQAGVSGKTGPLSPTSNTTATHSKRRATVI